MPSGRHGHPWSLQRVRVGAEPPATQPVTAADVVTVRALETWLRTLPPSNIQQLVVRDVVRYDPALLPGQYLEFGDASVQTNYTWVFTDVEFFALVASTRLTGAAVALPTEALVGLLRFELLFGSGTPYRTTGYGMSPYSEPAQESSSTGGWPWLEKPFGVQRMPSFALYARGGEEIKVRLTVESAPRFPIAQVGVNLHGFTIPTVLLEKVWSV